ncbi:hypothetical protein ES705_04926 [subsurface metagenome]
MTKSYLVNEIQQYELSELWEQNIVARRFSIKNITKQMTYNLRIYLREKESLTHIIIFLFLSIIQLFFYTLGAFIVRLRLRDMTSLRS